MFSTMGGAVEVLHDSSEKRTIIVAMAKESSSGELCDSLVPNFSVLPCSNASEAIKLMNERLNSLSAALISTDLADENDHAFLHTIKKERYFDTIPVLVCVNGEAGEQYIKYIESGAADIIELPSSPAILKLRIENAIQLRRSASFHEIESMLHRLPSMIFLKDADGRYVFSTQYWHHLDTGGDPKWTIRGKTDVDIRKDYENALKAMEADKEIIRTGKGTSYVIEINADGVQEFIQLIKEPVFDEQGNVSGIIALGNDVTESEKMKRELARHARIDALTGLGNRRAFNEFVDGIHDRDDFPIAIISADCDNLKVVNDTFGHLVGDEYIHMTAGILRGALPDETHAFRVGGDEFIAFVPNSNMEQARIITDSMRDKFEYFKLLKVDTRVSYGIAIINSDKENIQAMIDLADRRMYEEKASHKSKRA